MRMSGFATLTLLHRHFRCPFCYPSFSPVFLDGSYPHLFKRQRTTALMIFYLHAYRDVTAAAQGSQPHQRCPAWFHQAEANLLRRPLTYQHRSRTLQALEPLYGSPLSGFPTRLNGGLLSSSHLMCSYCTCNKVSVLLLVHTRVIRQIRTRRDRSRRDSSCVLISQHT